MEVVMVMKPINILAIVIAVAFIRRFRKSHAQGASVSQAVPSFSEPRTLNS